MAVHHFRTNVQIKDIIGQGLINNDNLAILELVKNSLDANAQEVKVIFENLKIDRNQKEIFRKDEDRIIKLVIQDDGFGMSEEDVVNKWLNIAYSEKKQTSNINERIFAGEKGVGRFSCDRLGKYLNLYSKKANSDKVIHVFIDWAKFEINERDTEIQHIDIEVNNITIADLKSKNFDIGESGTIMEMVELRSEWTDKKIKELKSNHLSKLIIPRDEFAASKTLIKLVCPDYPKNSGTIENKIFQELNFKTTSIESTIRNGVISTSLKHNGQNILKIEEENISYPLLKDVKITIYYLNPYAKVYFKKQTGVAPVNFGSIFLFKNGFRVPPYGDEGNDWLGLERRKGQGQARFFGTRDIAGAVEILDFENNFIAVSSREGLVENAALEQLRDEKSGIFYLTIKALEKFVVEGLKWDSAVSREYVNDFEQKLNSNKIGNEEYLEDEKTKTLRSLTTLDYIIKSRKGKINSIELNAELIEQLVEADKSNADKLLRGLEKFTGKIDEETESIIIKVRKALEEKEKQLIEARIQAEIEEEKRIQAEEKEKIEREARLKAEEEAKVKENQRLIAEAKRREAEIKSKEEEQKRKDAELKQREAEIKAKEEEQQRIIAEIREKEEKEKRVIAEEETKDTKKVLEKKKEQLSIVTSISSQDLENVTNLHHQVIVITDTIKTILLNTSRKLNKGVSLTNNEFKEIIDKIAFENNKIASMSKFGTRAIFEDFNTTAQNDIIVFIENYLQKISDYFGDSSLKVQFKPLINTYITSFKPLDLSIIIDNIKSNAIKANATILEIECKLNENKNLEITFLDNGKGLHSDIKEEEEIFQKGFTTTKSTGLGLYHIDSILKENKWEKKINNKKPNGFEFKIIISE